MKLNENSINSLTASNLFSGMASLTSLDLSSNQLANIPANVFADLSAVTTFSKQNAIAVDVLVAVLDPSEMV